MSQFKPMLAPSKSLSPTELKTFRAFPVLASPKLDGIRCCIIRGQAMARSLKPIPNKFIRECLMDFPELDGELMLRDPDATFQDVTSAVMSRDGKPDFCFWVFDCFEDPNLPFVKRLKAAHDHVRRYASDSRAIRLSHLAFTDADSLRSYALSSLEDGFEGIMLRSPQGRYKFGRATLTEGTLLKVKSLDDSEAEVIGFEEEMQNTNEPTLSELGTYRRSAHKGNKVGKNTLGKLVCLWQGMEIRVAGFTSAEASVIWDSRSR